MCFRCGPCSRKLILLGDMPSKISLSDISTIFYISGTKILNDSVIIFSEKLQAMEFSLEA